MKRAVVLVASVLLLGACGGIHPGAAAVVDGRTISMETLDRTAKVYCQLTIPVAAQQGQTSIDNREIRQQAISDLVVARITTDIVEERNLKVDESAVTVADDERDSIADGVKVDVDDAVRAIERSRLIGAQLAAIGADESNQQVTPENTEQLSQVGQGVVLDALDDYGVEFAPRLGLDEPGVASGEIGSLSVAPPPGENTPDQSALLRCS